MSALNRFDSIVAKCHVRAICVDKHFLFAGMGSTLYITKTTATGFGELVLKQNIFKTHVINGIKTFVDSESDSQIETIVSVYGNRFLSIYKFSYDLQNENFVFNGLLESHNFYDWILLVQMNPSLVFVVKAHNQVVLYDYRSIQLIDTIEGPDHCILYTAELLDVWQSPNGFVLMSGTVFKEIVFWSSYQTQIDGNYHTKCHQRLTGHDGVIFALNYNKSLNILVSASDDRSVRIWTASIPSETIIDSIEYWNQNQFTINHVFYGHLSRIWRVLSFSDPFPIVVSVGEDSSLYFWAINDKKLIQRVDGHRNSSVWSLAFDSKSLISYSGGSDSCIMCCDVRNAIKPFNSQMRRLQPKQVKFISINENLNLFCSTIGGDLVLTPADSDSAVDGIKNSDYSHMFQTYSAIDVNEDRNQILLGSKCGNIAVVDINKDKTYSFDIQVKNGHGTKVFSVHFINSISFVSCGFNGQLKVWHLKSFSVTSEHVLPKSRHRWPTAALYHQPLLVVGDRCGSIYAYELDTHEPIKEYRYLHGSNGVTAIQMKPKTNLMYSCGRNGKIFEFVLQETDCTLLRTYRIFADMEWIGNLCFDPITHQMSYIYGFDSRNFVIWDERQQRFIEIVDCGGGHRSWDFVVHQNGYHFSYTKQDDLFYCSKEMSKIDINTDLMISTVSHSKKINCCSLLFTKSLLYFATAGEENVIHLNSLDLDSNAFKVELYLFGHISNISAIACCPQKSPDSCLMVSVGGRTQLMLWSVDISDGQLVCKQLCNKFLWDSEDIRNRTKQMKQISPLDPQIRYLDTNICKVSEDRYMISTACSDSAFRLYIFSSKSSNFQLLNKTIFNTSCVLRILNAFESHIISASNDGTLKVWSYGEESDKLIADNFEDNKIELKSVFEKHLHDSGINALDIWQLKDNLWLIGSGGDDNTLLLSLFQYSNNNLTPISSVKESGIHSSQITGISILSDTRIVSASIDQRVIIWKYELHFEKLQLSLQPIATHISSIADISSIITTFVPHQNKWHSIICGEGFEALKYSIN